MADSIPEIAMANKAKYMKHAQAFQRTFGISLNHYWHIVTGFDIVKFDKWIGAKDKCLKDCIIEKYDEDAAELVHSLI